MVEVVATNSKSYLVQTIPDGFEAMSPVETLLTIVPMLFLIRKIKLGLIVVALL